MTGSDHVKGEGEADAANHGGNNSLHMNFVYG